MKWITRERIKVDRVACPWLIRTFIDPDAEFVFLPHNTDWAGIQERIVYDVPGAELGHHDEDVSFDSILKKYRLGDPVLALLAQIVRAADSHPADPAVSSMGSARQRLSRNGQKAMAERLSCRAELRNLEKLLRGFKRPRN
jgi:hypothetical protein